MIEKFEGEVCYCDHCGERVYYDDGAGSDRSYFEDGPYEVFEHVPWDVASANAGESAVLCSECVRFFEEGEEEDEDD